MGDLGAMLWRVRTTLPDRPGELAGLAQRCGDAGVNILALQVFPGIEDVTDEMVLRAPDGWGAADLAHLVGAGAVVQPCSEEALADQPARYVRAAREIVEAPMRFPEVLARLFDAEPDPVGARQHDVIGLTVGDVEVQVHRQAAFTDTERARGDAMASLVNVVLAREATARVGPPRVGSVPEYDVRGTSVTAYVDGVVVGHAVLGETALSDDGARTRSLELEVEPHFRRHGIGHRLLREAARLAATLGSDEVVLTFRAGDPAVTPLVLAAGLRSRIRMAGEHLTVRLPLRDLKPLTDAEVPS